MWQKLMNVTGGRCRRARRFCWRQTTPLPEPTKNHLHPPLGGEAQLGEGELIFLSANFANWEKTTGGNTGKERRMIMKFNAKTQDAKARRGTNEFYCKEHRERKEGTMLDGGAATPPDLDAEFANAATETITMLNEMRVGEDGWAQIAPFGDFPGVALVADGKGGFTREKAIQRMDRVAVTQMVNEYNRSRRGLSRFIKSRPLFVGHPDVPGMETRYPDQLPKGAFMSLKRRARTGFLGNRF